MRVFTAVRHAADPRRFYGGLWSANFYPALRELGHEIVESQTDLAPTSRFMGIADGFTDEELIARTETTQRVLEEVRVAQRSGPVHLFLSYFYNAHFDPAGFDELRRLGVPSVNFYCNSIYQFPLVAAIAAKADVSWHPERDARASYLAVGARPVWVQMGADPTLCHPVPGIARRPRACFVGQRYADRDRLAAALLRAGLPVDLYGAGWGGGTSATEAEEEPAVYLGREQLRAGSARAYWRVAAAEMRSAGVARGLSRMALQWRYRSETTALSPLLSGAAQGRSAALCDTFAKYEIVLNFSNVWADGRPGSTLVPHVRLRDFEGPMSRTCYLTGHSDEVTAFYDVGREIDTYQAAEELADKVRYYLAHPSAAEALREAGHRRALRDHTWRRRFEELVSKIGVAA